MTYTCAQCEVEITDREHKYSKTHFGEPLCREHQKNPGQNKVEKVPKSKYYKGDSHQDSWDEDYEWDGSGLSDKDWQYRYNMIKGRIAETLIQELFLSLGYNVFHYGMENTVPGIMKLLKNIRGDVATQIRRMPDFVIQDNKGKVYFIEVKFRADGNFTKKNLPKNYPYHNAFIVLVSKKHIKCLTVKELVEEDKEITPQSRNYLGYRKEFELDKDIIIDFCDFALTFFSEV